MNDSYTAHVDTFARDNLPPREDWPVLTFNLPELQYPARLNAAAELVDRMAAAGHRDRRAIIAADHAWSYGELERAVNQIAQALVEDLGLRTGNRVLLRGPNNAMMAACFLAVIKAGGIVIPTMPLLRAPELQKAVDKAEIGLALCDDRLLDELAAVEAASPVLRRVVSFGELRRLMAQKTGSFTAVETAAEDVALMAFTSGTTGKPKACVHFHRDILVMADTFSRHVLKPQPDDVCAGTPPLAFTFGLGAELVFPLRIGAAAYLIEQPSMDAVLDGIHRHGVTLLATAPTMYKALLPKVAEQGVGSLRKCLSAGEHLPKSVFEDWERETGIRIIDGIGSTEMIHIFISASGDDIRPGSTGKAVPGYEACVLDEDFNPLPPGSVGKLAVRGPTGCRYLADPRQKDYVVKGWNVTGDAFLMDEDGYFWFKARADDMIVSAGYNIGGPEVEEVLLRHDAVAECAVIGAPDPARGQIVKAFVVLRPGVTPSAALVEELQNFVKSSIAPYKYPRAVEFVDALPKTETGKIQRFKLRQQEEQRAQALVKES